MFRKLQEGSDKVEAIIVNACSLGGTAGFMDSIMTKLAQSAPKIPKIGYILYPSAHLSSSLVEIYNYTLSVNATLNHFDLVVPFDNEMLYTTAEKHLDV